MKLLTTYAVKTDNETNTTADELIKYLKENASSFPVGYAFARRPTIHVNNQRKASSKLLGFTNANFGSFYKPISTTLHE